MWLNSFLANSLALFKGDYILQYRLYGCKQHGCGVENESVPVRCRTFSTGFTVKGSEQVCFISVTARSLLEGMQGNQDFVVEPDVHSLEEDGKIFLKSFYIY